MNKKEDSNNKSSSSGSIVLIYRWTLVRRRRISGSGSSSRGGVGRHLPGLLRCSGRHGATEAEQYRLLLWGSELVLRAAPVSGPTVGAINGLVGLNTAALCLPLNALSDDRLSLSLFVIAIV